MPPAGLDEALNEVPVSGREARIPGGNRPRGPWGARPPCHPRQPDPNHCPQLAWGAHSHPLCTWLFVLASEDGILGDSHGHSVSLGVAPALLSAARWEAAFRHLVGVSQLGVGVGGHLGGGPAGLQGWGELSLSAPATWVWAGASRSVEWG